MEESAMASTRVDYKKLLHFVGASFEKLGVPSDDAQIAANGLVMADLRGVDTHGVIRFNPYSWYVKWLKEGSMTAKPNIRIVSENAATALIDGDNGMGMVVGHRAMEIAIQKAKSSGVAMVAARNSRHYGMSAYYAMRALAHDMIGIAMTNASRQVVPTFGRDARYGTNPICFAVPAKEEVAFVLDMATNTAAAGKLELAARLGKAIPLGWALDENAASTTDPRVAQKARRLLPLGGTRDRGSHKGYGLAILVEILCGVLTGTVKDSMTGSAKSSHSSTRRSTARASLPTCSVKTSGFLAAAIRFTARSMACGSMSVGRTTSLALLCSFSCTSSIMHSKGTPIRTGPAGGSIAM